MEQDWRERLKVDALKILQRNSLELFEMEINTSSKRWLVRIFIDSLEKPITIDDCEKVSKELSLLLDAEDFIPHSYILEISSPGVERKLRGKEDFLRFKGERCFIILKEIDEKRQSTYEGFIANVESDSVLIRDEKGVENLIPFENIKKAKLKLKFPK